MMVSRGSIAYFETFVQRGFCREAGNLDGTFRAVPKRTDAHRQPVYKPVGVVERKKTGRTRRLAH